MSALAVTEKNDRVGDMVDLSASASSLSRLSPVQHEPLLSSFAALEGNIGIYGGSFDPVHVAHLEAARLSREEKNLDAVVFIPARQNPHKDEAPLAGDNDRVNMLVEALRSRPGMYVSTIELAGRLAQQEASFTIDTLREIRSQLGTKGQLFLITGLDCMPVFHKWKQYTEVLAMATVISVTRPPSAGQPVTPRPDTPEEVREVFARNQVQMNLDISGRKIRAAIAAGQMPVDLITPEVARYIARQKLYGQPS